MLEIGVDPWGYCPWGLPLGDYPCPLREGLIGLSSSGWTSSVHIDPQVPSRDHDNDECTVLPRHAPSLGENLIMILSLLPRGRWVTDGLAWSCLT